MPGPFRLGFLPTVGSQQMVKPMFRTLGVAASGLSAQRMRMETIAQNVANANVTRTEDGGPYRRRVVQMTTAAPDGAPAGFPRLPALLNPSIGAAPTPPAEPLGFAQDAGAEGVGVRVTAIVEDPSEGPLVYDPGHPDADDNGYVRYPNVRTTEEIVDLMDARRVFEANATVFQSAKQMLRRAIDI